MRKVLVALTAACAASHVSATGIPVIDVTAVGNLIQQVAYWQQQIAAMSHQLSQLQQTHAAMTGGRGMQYVMPMDVQQRNYLPSSYAELMGVVSGHSATYAGLSTLVRSSIAHSSMLPTQHMASLSPSVREAVEERRRNAAMLTSLSQVAYQQTSQRFAAIQHLISIIGAAGDLKAIEDLQARVSAEQAMLQNEQTKLQTLHQMAQANQWVEQQRVRERAALEIGSVRTLRPVLSHGQGDQ